MARLQTIRILLAAGLAAGCQSFEATEAPPAPPDVDGGPADAGPPDAGPADAGQTVTVIDVTTIAGNGHAGFADGTGGRDGTAEFKSPNGVAVDTQGNVYVADTGNNRIRRIDLQGNVTTVAGNGTPGWVDGTGGPSGTAELFGPRGVAVDLLGNVIVADTSNDRIRRIDPEGNVTTIAGNGNVGTASGTGGPNGTAEFEYPYGVTLDVSGIIYVADPWTNLIREIDAAGDVMTFAGTGWGSADGSTSVAAFDLPWGVAVDSAGNVYTADAQNNRIREVSPAGVVTTVAGNGDGTDDGPGGFADGTGGPNGSAEFKSPEGVAVDASGNIFVADTLNYRIRRIDPNNYVSTYAGNGNAGSADGTGGGDGTAELYGPTGVAVDAQGNVYVADCWNNRIRKITLVTSN